MLMGELFDDYSPSHPATQLDDMKARLTRMAWIRDTHNMVVGSEGGFRLRYRDNPLRSRDDDSRYWMG